MKRSERFFYVVTLFQSFHRWMSDAHELICLLQAVEFDPPRDPSVFHPTAPAWIRLVYDKEIHGKLGVVDVSSDDEVAFPGIEPVLSKRWRAGVLQPQAGVEVELFCPEPLDLQDALLLPTSSNTCPGKTPLTVHIDQLAARWWLSKPGLLTVLKSMALYCKSRANALGHAPSHYSSILEAVF
eukprot:Skav234078  [mRNA]  locus=scaffold2565:289129:289677:+ [translate_table: standard]